MQNTNTLLILSIIFAAVAAVTLIVFVILIARFSLKNNRVDKKEEDYSLKIDERLNAIEDSLKQTINNSMTANLLNANTATNQSLDNFKDSITTNIDKKFESIIVSLNSQLALMNKRVDERLEGGFKNTNESIQNFRERLSKIDAAQQNIEKLSSQVVSLQDILENNQQRGQYGEFQLSMILKNVFGDTVHLYEEQYQLKFGKQVDGYPRADAVVFLPEPYKMICIDSKFPFQNYKDIIDAKNHNNDYEDAKKGFRAAVKKHINDIKSKYIVKGETAKQAIMFIPSDGIFAFLHVELYDVIQEAQANNVLVASPATLQAMLATMAMFKINYDKSKNIDIITQQLTRLAKEFDKWNDDWAKFTKHLDTVSRTKDELNKRTRVMTKEFNKINSAEIKQLETNGQQIESSFDEEFEDYDE